MVGVSPMGVVPAIGAVSALVSRSAVSAVICGRHMARVIRLSGSMGAMVGVSPVRAVVGVSPMICMGAVTRMRVLGRRGRGLTRHGVTGVGVGRRRGRRRGVLVVGVRVLGEGRGGG